MDDQQRQRERATLAAAYQAPTPTWPPPLLDNRPDGAIAPGGRSSLTSQPPGRP